MRPFFFCLLLFSISLMHACQNGFTATEAFDRGHEVYLANCVSCHAIDGLGNNGTYPPLATREINASTTNRTIAIIKEGSALMKPIRLDDEEIVDVINYIQNAWGQRSEPLGIEQLKLLTNAE